MKYSAGGKKIKIIRIIARLNIGGPAIHAVLLTSELNKRGYIDTLVCGRVGESEGDMAYLAKEKGVTPIVIEEMSREISPLRDMIAFFKLFRIIMKERPDIVHTHTAKAGTLGRLAAIFAGVPVRIHTFHGHIFDGYFSPVKAKIFLWVERFLALFTDKVITVSQSVKDEIVNKLKITGDSKCAVVPLGFELGKFLECGKNAGRYKKSLRLGDGTMLVGIVGRLVPIKNHEVFLNAARIILDNGFHGKVKFIVIGDGELRKHLEGYAKKIRLEQDIIFAGWVQALEEAYADLDIVALTSLNEGTPVSLIEAMASGKPVVATSVGGVPDLIENGVNGYLVNNNDARDLASKIMTLLKGPDTRARFGERGREFVRARYSKDRLINDMERLYEECLTKT